MRKIKWILFATIIVAFSSCKKEMISQTSFSDEDLALKRQQVFNQLRSKYSIPNVFAEAKTYNGFVNLNLSNGLYTNGSTYFDQIIYSTGDYLDGEAVDEISLYFDPILTPNVLWWTTIGPFYVYVQGTALGGSYSPDFLNELDSFNTVYDNYLSGADTLTMPNLEDYLPQDGTSTGELITKGVVVRRHSSSTTLATAPDTFSPVGPPATYTLLLGYLTQGNYDIYVFAKSSTLGMPSQGPLVNVEVYDISNGYQSVGLNGFVGSFIKRQLPLSGFVVEGEFTLSNNSEVEFSGIADGM